MDVQQQKTLLANEGQQLIQELESLYLSGAWRHDPAKVAREREIKELLDKNFAEAQKLPAY